MAKQRLVVVGNGMAGARTVEEILARGGGDRFDITMFGDEPYGNYNRIERRFRGLESPGKLKLATAGCPRNCSEALVKDVGAVAVEGGRWEIYVGGAAGSHIRKGDLLCTVDSHEAVLQLSGRFIQYYREHAKYLSLIHI